MDSRFVTSRDVKCDYVVDSTVLGEGINGAVLLAKGKHDGRHYAVKRLRKSSKREAEVYLSLDHPHIARLERVYENDEHIHIVMERLGGGELFYGVVESNGYSESRAACALQQMLSAVAYLHAKQVVHRDLKLENFLYTDDKLQHLKMIDFGHATVWDCCTEMRDVLGTTSYIAPEMVKRCYTEKADMWSMGVIAFMMLTATQPFTGRNEAEVHNNIKCGQRDSRNSSKFEKLSSQAKDFVNSLLKLDPAKRLSAADALKHPWIREYNQMKTSPERTVPCRSQQYSSVITNWPADYNDDFDVTDVEFERFMLVQGW